MEARAKVDLFLLWHLLIEVLPLASAAAARASAHKHPVLFTRYPLRVQRQRLLFLFLSFASLLPFCSYISPHMRRITRSANSKAPLLVSS